MEFLELFGLSYSYFFEISSICLTLPLVSLFYKNTVADLPAELGVLDLENGFYIGMLNSYLSSSEVF